MAPSKEFPDQEIPMTVNEKTYLNFIIDKLETYGSLPLQNLCGHLSQLPSNVRNEVGSTKFQLKIFLSKHNDIFYLDKNMDVHLCEMENDTADSVCSKSSGSHSTITHGFGRINKVYPTHGFISAFDPVVTTVYFQANTFIDCKTNILSVSQLQGQKVGFNAAIGPIECSNPYRATKVWRFVEDTKDDDDDSKSFLPRTKRKAFNRTDSDVKNYSPPKQLVSPTKLSGKGNIEKLFAAYGFIIPKGNKQERVYFTRKECTSFDFSTLHTYDAVNFEAKLSSLPTNRCKWQATSVALYEKLVAESAKNPPTKLDLINHYICKKMGSSSPCIIKDEIGKIIPTDIKCADILFGQEDEYLIKTSPNCLFYMHDMDVEDVCWEYCDFDNIKFDAVQAIDEWQAVVVWMGDKPYVPPELYNVLNHSLPCENDDDISLKKKDVNELSVPSIESSTYSYSFAGSRNWADAPYPEDEQEKVPETSMGNVHVSYIQADYKPSISENGKSDVQLNSNVETLTDTHTNMSLVSYESILSDSASNTSSSNKYSGFDDDQYSTLGTEESGKRIEGNIGNEIVLTSSNESLQVEDDKKSDASPPVTEVEPPMKKTSVKMFKGITGRVKKLFNYIVEIDCKDLSKAIPLIWKDMYFNGTIIYESERGKFIKPGDEVNLNCFEIVDDSLHLWQKATLAWIGQKPSVVSEMNPKEFIEANELKVTCLDGDIPTWDNYEKLDAIKKNRETISNSTVSNTIEFECHNSKVSTSKNRNKNVADSLHVSLETQPNLNVNASKCMQVKTSKSVEQQLLSNIAKLKAMVNSAESQLVLDDLLCNVQAIMKIPCEAQEPVSNSNEKYKFETTGHGLSKDIACQTIVTGNIISMGIFTQ